MRNLRGVTLASLLRLMLLRLPVPLITGATEEQKEIWLRRVAEQGHLASYAVTEPGAGSDVAACKTTAVLDGDEYVINGEKMWITGAGYSDFFFVLAKTDINAGYRGMSGFIVERDAEDFPWAKKRQTWDKDVLTQGQLYSIM